jgi:hypothetical protein
MRAPEWCSSARAASRSAERDERSFSYGSLANSSSGELAFGT